MGERAYTVAEIDRMRSAVVALLRPIDIGYSANDLERSVELRLRTYLEQGISPDDLVDHVRSVRPSAFRERA